MGEIWVDGKDMVVPFRFVAGLDVCNVGGRRGVDVFISSA
jgi:hypothetical protein